MRATRKVRLVSLLLLLLLLEVNVGAGDVMVMVMFMRLYLKIVLFSSIGYFPWGMNFPRISV